MLTLVRRLSQLTVAVVQDRISAPVQARGLESDDKDFRLSNGDACREVAWATTRVIQRIVVDLMTMAVGV